MAPITDAPVAASSPAPSPEITQPDTPVAAEVVSTEAAEALADKPIEVWTDTERDSWLRTGKVPKVSPKPAESAPAPKENSDAEAAPAEKLASEAESAPASEPDVTQEKAPKRSAEARKQQLAEEIQDLLAQRAQLRAEVASSREPGDKKAPPAGETATTASDKEPLLEDCDSLQDFVRKHSDWTVREYERKGQQQALIAKRQERIEGARKEFPDFDQVFTEKLPVSAVMADFLFGSEIFGKLAHNLGSNPGEALRIAKLPPLAAVRELTKLELALSKPAESTVTPVAPAKRITSAPPPPAEIAGSSAPVVDEAEAALKNGDFATYKRVMNARDKAKGRG
jgi:hypothetical protein